MIDGNRASPDEPPEDLAEQVLRKAGVAGGQTVLDFGCGRGTYTIPAARIVGDEGTVYAVDEDESKIRRLREGLQSAGLHNVCVRDAIGRAVVKLPDESADVILLYDVLHSWYHPQSQQRKAILKELHTILRPEGFLSFYPGDPEVFGKQGELATILTDIRETNFRLQSKCAQRLIHEGNLVRGHVFRFVKTSSHR